MIYFLIVLYAVLMGAAAFVKRRNLGPTLTAANLLGSAILVCTPIQPIFLWLGLMWLIGCALCNGHVLQGRIRIQHVLIRGVFSLFLLISYTLL